MKKRDLSVAIVPDEVALPQKFKRLRELVVAINDRHDEIMAIKSQADGLVNSLGVTLRLQGLDLIEARKDVPHGDWYDWLAVHCPKVTPRVASFCVGLANRQRVADLAECETWRDCWALVKADLPPAPPAAARPWPVVPNLRNLQLFERWTAAIQTAPLERCPAAILDRYRELAEPIARLLWPEKFA